MSDNSKIEWTDATWNPITGCAISTPGCINCYAMRLAATRLRNHPSRKGLAKFVKDKPVWTGEVRFNEGWIKQPLEWSKPRRIFVCAHGDLFYEEVPDEWIDKVFAVMACSQRHTFQVLTKRADRMLESVMRIGKNIDIIEQHARDMGFTLKFQGHGLVPWPLPNVWLGVSAERQQEADKRVPALLRTPAAVRFVSAEPLIAPIDFEHIFHQYREWLAIRHQSSEAKKIDWMIVGGESGPGHRDMDPAWAGSIREQCNSAGVAFFMKQMAGKKPIPAELMHREFPSTQMRRE